MTRHQPLSLAAPECSTLDARAHRRATTRSKVNTVGWVRRLLPLFAFALVCMSYGEAHARRGIMLITSGDSITEVAPLDPEAAKAVEAETGAGAAIGYKYEQFGVFWLEIWSWDGKYVLFNGDDYWDIPDEQLAAMAGVGSLDELSKPLTYTIPPGLAIIVVAVLGFGAFAIFSKGDDEDEDDAVGGQPAGPTSLANDPRYQQAIAAYHANPGNHDQKISAAVALLMQHGVDHQQGYANLMALLNPQAQPQPGHGQGGYPPGQG